MGSPAAASSQPTVNVTPFCSAVAVCVYVEVVAVVAISLSEDWAAGSAVALSGRLSAVL